MMKTTQPSALNFNANHRLLSEGRTLWIAVIFLFILHSPFCIPPESASAQSGAGTHPEALADCPASISFGETIHCSIAAVGETDAYTFMAGAGDRVLVRMSKTELGSLWPGVIVNGTGGAELCEQNSMDSTTAEITSCTLPDTGTYTILAHDGLYGTFTGDYHLYLQRMNNPGDPVSIAFGQTLPASIITSAEMDTYMFAASAGDKVLVRISQSSGNLWPGVRIYGPEGTKICQQTSSDSKTAEIAGCILPDSGTYTILGYDDLYGMYTGNYHIYMQRMNNPGDPVAISFGQTVSGSILTSAEMDTYTFTARAGDRVRVSVTQTSGNLWPGVRIYGPDGTKLCEKHSPDSVTAEIASCSLTSAGTHTILVFDDLYGSYTGEYTIYLELLKYPRAYLPLTIK